jgi:hypothetical protein
MDCCVNAYHLRQKRHILALLSFMSLGRFDEGVRFIGNMMATIGGSHRAVADAASEAAEEAG